MVMLIKLFQNYLEEFKDQQEPITLALAEMMDYVRENKSDVSYIDMETFDIWFEDQYYENGKPIEKFKHPLIHDMPVLSGNRPIFFTIRD
jgi:hypothetical protein